MSKLFPVWDEMGAARRVFEVGVLPVIGGVASGLAGTATTPLYLLNTWAALTGAVVIGSQHRDRRTAALRGVASGAIYATVLVLVLNLRGGTRVGPDLLLPESDVLLFLLMLLPSIPLHLLGSALRTRLSPAPEPVAV